MSTDLPASASTTSRVLRLLYQRQEQHTRDEAVSRIVAIISSILVGLIIIGLIIIVRLEHRRRLRIQVEGRQRVNLNPLHERSLRSRTGLASLLRTYPGGFRVTRNVSSSSELAGMTPLLYRNSGPSSPKAAPPFDDLPKPLGSSLPPLHHPSLSSTYMYQFPPPPNQQNWDDFYLYYQTASTAAPGQFSDFVNCGNEGGGSRVVSEFDTQPGTVLERPSPSLVPSSPKKSMRDLPLPFATTNSHSGVMGGPTSTFLSYTEIKLAASQPYSNTTSTISSGTRSTSPQRPAFFSYHSTVKRKAVGPIPEFPSATSDGVLGTVTTSEKPRGPEASQPTPVSPTSDADTESLYSEVSLTRETTMDSFRTSTGNTGGKDTRRKMTNGRTAEMPAVPEGDATEEIVNGRDAGNGGADFEPVSLFAMELWPSPIDTYEATSPQELEAADFLPQIGLGRMDTVAIGNLIKSRAAKISRDVMLSDDVSPIERRGSIVPSIEVNNDRKHRGRDQEPLVRVRRARQEELQGGNQEGYGQITRVPVKRTVTEIKTKSRSTSRGRLVPKTSLKHGEDVQKNLEVEGEPTPPIPHLVGFDLVKNFKPKAGLLLAGAEETTMQGTATANPQLGSPPSEERQKINWSPLTDAFGLGRSHSVRSPVTPALHCDDLDQMKPLLPPHDPLNLITD